MSSHTLGGIFDIKGEEKVLHDGCLFDRCCFQYFCHFCELAVYMTTNMNCLDC